MTKAWGLTTRRFPGLKAGSLVAGIVAGLAFSGLPVQPANAADLGGDCCADLEERVAELEATTVRKGNRKVSVTFYGHVNRAVMWYDNGEESDVYNVDSEVSNTRFGVKGSGKVRPDLEIGFKLEIETARASSSGVTENDGDNTDQSDGSIFVRHEYWYVKSDTLGTLSVGQQSQATDGTMEVDLSGPAGEAAISATSDWSNNFGLYDSASNTYLVDGAGDRITWGRVLSNFDAGRRGLVRYDTPAFVGFTVSASWGEDDEADVALRYAGEFSGLKVAAAVGYLWDDDDNNGPERETWGGSASLWHQPSGLFVVAQYAERDFNSTDPARDDGQTYYFKGGIRQKFTDLGETAVYGEYGKTNDLRQDVEATTYGVGIGQSIDAVGATAYLGYRRHQADISNSTVDVADFDSVFGGMKVPF